MRASSLFSGIGAPEVAMPGWDWRWHAEIEKFPAAVMAERHPLSANLGDVTAHDFSERALGIGRPDVLVFGSPCQSFSVAGRRLGLDDPRGNLALVALGVVARLEPVWFVFENVPGLLSASDGRDFGLFLRAVDDLGYHLAWTVLDAQYAGVAQRRLRLFAVGHARDWRYPAAILFEPESLSGHPPTRGEARQDVAPTLGAGPVSGGRTYGTDAETAPSLQVCPTLRAGGNRTGGDRPPGTDADTADSLIVTSTGERAHCLNAGGMGRIDYESETLVAHSLRADGFDASEDGTGRGTPIVAVQQNGTNLGTGLPSLRRGDGGFTSGVPAVAFDWQSGGSQARLEPRPNISALSRSQTPAVAVALRGREGGGTAELGGETAMALRASQGGGDKPHVLASGVRRLTPRECERLQGFPDDYTLITYRGKPAKDGPRYKAIGNSMAVPVIRWILQRIDRLHRWDREHVA